MTFHSRSALEEEEEEEGEGEGEKGERREERGERRGERRGLGWRASAVELWRRTHRQGAPVGTQRSPQIERG
jgi:hypothetical protein